MKKPIVAGNWKMNKGPLETKSYMNEFLEKLNEKEQEHFMIFPPAIDSLIVADHLRDSAVRWGAQNTYSQDSGAFTGENSAYVLKDLGASVSLVGHSERRQVFGETDEEVAEKVVYLQNLGLVPVLCLGETIEQREADQTNEVVFYQLTKGLSKSYLDFDFILAYEPVWAIGTGKVATPEIAEEVHGLIRSELAQLTSPERAAKIPILYGGSVKPSNAAELYAQENIDGFLVGGASLEVESFIGIYKNCLA